MFTAITGRCRIFLETARVYDRTTGSWIGGDTVVVQCGDVLDRASEELSCLELLCHLSHLAAQSGGRVICLVGNHEVLNSLGDFDYASDDDTEHELVVGRKIDYFLDSRNWRIQYGRNHPSRWASYEPNGVLSKSLLSKMKIAVRVGNTVCIHAGLRPSHLRDYGGIEGMNRSYRNWICDDCGDDDDESTVASVKFDYRDDGGASILSKIMTGGGNDFGRRRKSSQQALRYNHVIQRRQHYIDTVPKFLTGSQGPVWMRDYSSPSGKLPIGSGVGAGFYGGYSDEDGGNAIQKMMDETLLLLGADRMVMGHTIQSQINSALNGKAWRIDVGASRGCGSGKPEVLEIIHAGAASNATDGGGTACTGTDIVSVLSSQNKTVPAIERSLEKLQEKRKEALF